MMIESIGELKTLIADLDDNMPVQAELQGEQTWDYSLYVCLAEENEEGIDVFTISMDL